MKKLLTLSLTFLMATSLAACSSKGDTASSETPTDISSEAPSETPSEITISHSRGETTIKTNPKKVVVFDMGTLDTMEQLGVEAEMAFPLKNRQEYIEGYENAVNAGGLKEPDFETIHTFAPDVIFISGRQSDFYDDLNEIAPTVFVDLNYDTYLDDFKRNVELIGDIFNKQDLAKEELAKIDDKIKAANEKTKDLQDKGLILMTTGGKLKAYPSKSRFGFIHDVLGFKEADENMYKEGEERDTHGKEVSFEYVSSVNPDLLFVLDRDAAIGNNEDGKDSKSVIDNDLVNQTNAVKNGKVAFLSPGPWYIASGGLQSFNIMIDEAMSILN